MVDRQCETCEDFETPLTEEPCSVCNLFAGDPSLNMWRERPNKRDGVAVKLRGKQRKRQPYRRVKAGMEEADSNG